MNILIGGEAGQGLATVGEILAKCLGRSGYYIVVTQSYQSRIRGGHNTFAIRVSSQPIWAPRESYDLLVALNEETITLHQKELTSSGLIVADQGCAVDEKNCLRVPFGHLAPRPLANVAALGVASALLGLDHNLVSLTLEKFFGKKKPELSKENQQVLQAAYQWATTQPLSLPKLPKISDPPPRLILQGNEAIALGAISAGLKFYAFYPMTPSTSIGLTLARLAGEMELVVEQAEDEIAAINMAIGASFAGAPSMVGTSGGGFALMVEGVSLAGMTETPLVIVVAQRPGPATGLPTRTEQADLNFVLHAGHGEFPRAILAPATVEECFYLTHQAFHLAEKFQSPVFILTDQFLADSYRAVEPFTLAGLTPVSLLLKDQSYSLPYRRFALTENGVSPRLLPGLSEHLVVAGSDEHTEDGHLTEDLEVRKKMVEKRLRKMDGLRQEIILPSFEGKEQPDLLLLSWGSTKGAVSEAAEILRSAGQKVSTLHFSQVWPLPTEYFLKYLQGAKKIISIEGNATGQFASLLRRESGLDVSYKISRYDGLPITPDYILRKLGEINLW
ncbi:MAG: 2-oxoacid:acceptor oxidoreductase subunit alpha [Thermodesulfobacteriota bacterium]